MGVTSISTALSSLGEKKKSCDQQLIVAEEKLQRQQAELEQFEEGLLTVATSKFAVIQGRIEKESKPRLDAMKKIRKLKAAIIQNNVEAQSPDSQTEAKQKEYEEVSKVLAAKLAQAKKELAALNIQASERLQ